LQVINIANQWYSLSCFKLL